MKSHTVLPVALALALAPAVSSAEAEPQAASEAASPAKAPKPRDNPKAWFASFFKVGERCPGMGSWREFPPELLLGADIIAKIEADKLASNEVSADPRFKEVILPAEKYWYWTSQGPMSDHQMHVILKGASISEGVVIYARIQERPCF